MSTEFIDLVAQFEVLKSEVATLRKTVESLLAPAESFDDVVPTKTKPKKRAPAKKVTEKKTESEAEVASDADLDSKYGDPTVFMNPKRWEGEDYKGSKFSDCPSDYLLELAKMLDWFAADNKSKNALASNGKPKHVYQEMDAKRARGWAKRNSGEPKEAPVVDTFDDEGEDKYKF